MDWSWGGERKVDATMDCDGEVFVIESMNPVAGELGGRGKHLNDGMDRMPGMG